MMTYPFDSDKYKSWEVCVYAFILHANPLSPEEWSPVDLYLQTRASRIASIMGQVCIEHWSTALYSLLVNSLGKEK